MSGADLGEYLRENFKDYWNLHWKDRPRPKPKPLPDLEPKPIPQVVFVDNPAEKERYKYYMPKVSLAAAAGAFSEAQDPGLAMAEQAETWVRVNRKLSRGMFAAEVVGRSMEPTIPSGSLCLFHPVAGGTKAGRVVLAQLHRDEDPEHGGRYTVKHYNSEKEEGEDGNPRITRILLSPKNPDFEPLIFDPEDAEGLTILAEFQGVLK